MKDLTIDLDILFRALFEDSAIGMAVVSPQGNFIKVNKQLCVLTGYSQKELTGMNFRNITHPEDLGNDEEFIKEALAGRTDTFRVEKRYFRKDGSTISVRLNACAVRNSKGELNFFVGQIEDITQKREAEMKFRGLVEGAPVGVYISQNEKFVYVNPAFSEITGYSEEDLVNKMSVFDMILPEFEPVVREQVRRRKAGEMKHVHYEVKGRKKNGSLGWIEVFGSSAMFNGNEAMIGTFTDITKRKETTALVLHEKNLSDSIINALPGIFYLADTDGRLLRWNKNLEVISGHTGEELSKMQTTDLVGPDYVPLILEKRKGVISTGKGDIELTLLTAQKEIRHYYFTVMNAVYDFVPRMIGIGVDVTEKKESQKALARMNAQIKERIKELNCLYKISEIANDQSKTMEEFFTQSTELIVQAFQYPDITSARIIFQGKDYSSTEFVKGPYKMETNIFSNRLSIGRIEVYYKEPKPDEDEGPFLKEERFLLNSISDILSGAYERRKAEITLRQSEEKYRYLFHNAPAIVIIWDLKEMKVLEVNNQALNTYGYTLDEFIGMSCLKYRPEEDHERIRDFARRMLDGGIPRLHTIWRHYKKSGELMYMDITSHKMDYNGRKAILSLAKDITEQYKAQMDLKQAYENIRVLNKHIQTAREDERSMISREIHDELGQQLTGIKMDVSWMLKKVGTDGPITSERAKEVIELIDGAVKTVRKIASDLRPGVLDDLGLVAALEWQTMEFEKRSGIKCDFSSIGIKNEPEKNIATAIFRIYQESLTNIMRHAQATRVVASLDVLGTESLMLKVSDNGKGFCKEDAADKKTLGLMGMRERAAMFGGKLSITSEREKGTDIVLTMPLKDN